MFRVYDLKKEEWIKSDDIFISKDDVLVEMKFRKKVLNNKKNKERYVCHRHIECFDKNNRHIFEGDILKLDNSDKKIVGIVVYVEEVASYMLLDYKNKTCYSLGKEICSNLQIIGNVFDDKNILKLVTDNDIKDDFKVI